jgi:hypothetical protein
MKRSPGLFGSLEVGKMECDNLRNSARGQLVLKEFRKGTQSCDQRLQDGRLWQVDLAGFCDFSFGKV